MRKRIRSFLILLAATIAASSARADAYEDVTAATSKGDYPAAVKILKPLAEKGEARAMSELGPIYLMGKGVPVDHKEAIKWIRQAAEKGDAAAQANLGTMYLDGHILKQDYAEAMKWSLLAAGKGVAAAQANIASMYYDGSGVGQDYKEAAKWMRLAAKQGDAESQVNLGTMYVAGQGLDRDLLRGYMWTAIGLEPLSMPPDQKKEMQELSAQLLSEPDLAKAKEMVKKCKESQFKNCD
ncbi:tetratricopeptide repeat protein [Methylocystis iwaonis]|uniref:tetratricopeptide repeat protein n=1 Tax=Methylocystis iwaonis TaxID=2885079 RepID=UPI002E7C01FF|nr:tetratricopeptide repeat protein [Methylocystis iwaonis]